MQFTARGQDVRRYLSTKTSYAFRLPILNAPSLYNTPDPDGYEVHYMWLLSRHGTRWPTADRMRQINSLENLFKDARNVQDYPWVQNWTSPLAHMSAASGELHPIGEDELWSLGRRLRQRLPALMQHHYLPKRYPIVSTQVSRAAASASAFAAGFFPTVETAADLRSAAAALLANSNDERPASALKRPQAVAINMAPKHKDPLLRFFEMCPTYAQREEWLEKWLSGWMARNWSELIPAVEERLGMQRAMDACDVEALWTLCQFEAGTQGRADGVCGLFRPEELSVLEWVTDVSLLESLAWGSHINYAIAAPLLQDLRESLQTAAQSSGPPKQRSRLLFAHCETIVPLATLMGLFQPELPPPPDHARDPSTAVLEEVAPAAEARRLLASVDALEDVHLRLQQASSSTTTKLDSSSNNGNGNGNGNGGTSAKQQMFAGTASQQAVKEGVEVCAKGRPPNMKAKVPRGWYPMTPHADTRIFRGGRVAPYGANMAVILYRPKGSSSLSGSASLDGHRIRLVYNEQVIQMPGCSGGSNGQHLDCDLQEFLDLTAAAAANDPLGGDMCKLEGGLRAAVQSLKSSAAEAA